MRDRFSSLKTPSLTLSNRVVVPPMASQTADEAGFATPKTLAHYRRLADSGAGLLFFEYSFVNQEGRSEPNQLGLSEDAHVPALRAVVDDLRRPGLTLGIQLTHCGGKGSSELSGRLAAPSAVRVPSRVGELEIPTPLRLDEVPGFQRAFVDAAGRAEAAGFDLVELHAAHGYGLNQWLSPLTNRRTDRYGGSLANRSRMLLEIVREVRRHFPNLALAVRLAGQDLLEGGLDLEQTGWVARQLEAAGVELLDVSSGMGGWMRPRDRRGQGYLVPEASALTQAVNIPVIGVGGIQDGPWIDSALRAGHLHLAAVGRAVLADPAGFRAAVLEVSAAG